MDFLNKAYSQLADLVRSMTPAARVTAALLAGVIVVGLAFLFRFQTQTADDYLLGGRPFMAGELTAVQRALSEAKLTNWELEGNRIKIPSGQKAAYIAALAENNALPTDWNAAMDKAVDGSNPFRSRHEIDLTMQRAKQKELSLVISRFHNVEQASVMFDETERGNFRKDKHKTASVAVQTSGLGLEEPQVRAIRNLLATSYAGLNRENITITDTTTGISYAGSLGENGAGGENVYAERKAQFETLFKKKILDQLANVVGIMVGVNVELDAELNSNTTTVKVDPKSIPIKSSEKATETTSTSPSNQGRPGVASNGVTGAVGNQPAEVASVGARSTLSETTSDQSSVPGGFTKESKFLPGMNPRHVTAAINVPSSYYLKIWRQLNPTPAGQPAKEPDAAELKKIETDEKTRIENAIVNLLPPPPPGKTPYPLVTVTTYTDLPSAAPVAIPLLTQITDWLSGNWRSVAMLGVGLVGLVMLRGMLRNTPAPLANDVSASSESHDHATHDAEPAAEEDKPEPILKMRRKLSSKGPNLREELRQLVKDDPDAAANVLRGWIGDAA
jgi:flagellar M-ring protein FliF